MNYSTIVTTDEKGFKYIKKEYENGAVVVESANDPSYYTSEEVETLYSNGYIDEYMREVLLGERDISAEQPVSLEEKITALEEQNEMLVECIMEMSELVYG